MMPKLKKATWRQLWVCAKNDLVPDARTPIRIFKAWVERCAIYYIWRYENKHILGHVFGWLEFHVTRKWKFKPVQYHYCDDDRVDPSCDLSQMVPEGDESFCWRGIKECAGCEYAGDCSDE